jgi:hypothetical protein
MVVSNRKRNRRSHFLISRLSSNSELVATLLSILEGFGFNTGERSLWQFKPVGENG